MIKKTQTELVAFLLLTISVLLSHNIDVGVYSYFSKLNYSFGSIYLKDFFVSITELGDSLWYFLIFICIFLISVFAYKITFLSIGIFSYLKNFSLFGFCCLLSVGFVTQALKHMIGRPRPNHVDITQDFGFKFFTTESNFHSFPSGHSSTIMVMALIASALLPKLRWFFYFCGFLIALSRVVVGAHFVSDVIAGVLVSLVVYKIINLFFKKKFPKLESKNFEIPNTSVLLRVLVVFCFFALFITVGFNFDIYFSGLFYYDNNQFLLQSFDMISILFRKVLLPLLLIYIFVLPFFGSVSLVQKIYFKYKFSFNNIFFIWFSGLTTLILFVNLLLKNTWGRARPNEILEFGGSGVFTPWYKFGDSCVSNCSFVSGDASVGFMLVVFYFITKKNIYCYLALVFGTLLGFVRILAGGHFLSDIIFSNIVVFTIVGICFVLFKKIYVR